MEENKLYQPFDLKLKHLPRNPDPFQLTGKVHVGEFEEVIWGGWNDDNLPFFRVVPRKMETIVPYPLFALLRDAKDGLRILLMKDGELVGEGEARY